MLLPDIFFNFIGLIGSAIVIYAFYFIQQERCNMIKYNIMNLTGALLLLASLTRNPNFGSIIIELFYIIISIYGIIKSKNETNNHHNK